MPTLMGNGRKNCCSKSRHCSAMLRSGGAGVGQVVAGDLEDAGPWATLHWIRFARARLHFDDLCKNADI